MAAAGAASRYRHLPALPAGQLDEAKLAARRQAREERRKPKRIVIFCNGDVFFKGKKFTIQPSRFLSYNDLLQDLTHNMPQSLYLPNGVRQLFSPNSGRRIGNIADLRDGGAYVCAGNETFKHVKYGESELTPWGKGRSQHHHYQYDSTPTQQSTQAESQFAGYNAFPPSRFLRHPKRRRPSIQGVGSSTSNRFAALRGMANDSSVAAGPSRPPKIVTVVKDGDRPRQIVKVLLNRRGIQSYQQVLNDISDSFGQRGRRERLRMLFTINGREVRDINDLFHDDEVFVGCCNDIPTIDAISDLLEELYPGNSAVKSLLKDWERRLARKQKRQQQQQPQKQQRQKEQQNQQKPPRVEERDSGYDESEPGTGAEGKTTPTKASSEKMRQTLEARRHSRPLPLLHEASADAEAEQRQKEVQRLQEEAATAKKEKQQRLSKQRKHQQKQQKVQQQQPHELPKAHAVLPPIPQASDSEPQRVEKKKIEQPEPVDESPSRKQKQEKDKEEQQREKEKEKQKESQQQVDEEQQQKKQQSPKRAAVSPDRQLTPVTEEKEVETEVKEEEVEAEKVEKKETPRKKPQQDEKQSSSRRADKPTKAEAKSSKESEQVQSQAEEDTTPPPLIRPISSSRHINEQYDMGKVMGDGNFAIVRVCTKKSTRSEYAMKVIDKAKLRGKEHMVISEVRIMKLCQHRNIVRLYEEYETKSEIFLVMELVKGGDLFDAISQVVKFNEVQSAGMVTDVANALHYLHSRKIVHRDLKPENLLVYRSGNGKISLKLGDFGLAMEVEKPIYTVCGTPTYVAPEILEERGYGLEVDLWALGVIMYILLCGFPPFRSRDRKQTELFQFIKSGQFEFLSPYWDHISPAAKDLIRNLLIVDRKRRYTAIDVLCHQWVLSAGNSKKPDTKSAMREQQHKTREKLEKEAEEAMTEFQQVKATSIYGNVR